MLPLWDHQAEAVQASCADLAAGIRSLAIQSATGSGKSTIAAEIARLFMPHGRVLLLGHTKEIVSQLAVAVRDRCGIEPGLDMADLEKSGTRPSNGQRVVCGGIATLVNRMEKFNPREFVAVIMDELHHYLLVSRGGTLLEHFGFLQWNGKQRERTGRGPFVIGLTATIKRGDGCRLDGIFEKIAYTCSIERLVNDGVLSDFREEQYRTGVSLEHIKVGREDGEMDFRADSLMPIINVPKRNLLALDVWRQTYRDRQFIAFCCPGKNNAHAREFADLCRRSGLLVARLSGKTPAHERDAMLSAFKSGCLHGLVNTDVLTEGVDLPSAAVGLMMSPTLSQPRNTQRAGRLLRKWDAATWTERHPEAPWLGGAIGLRDDKPEAVLCYLMDTYHKLQIQASLRGLPEPELTRRRPAADPPVAEGAINRAPTASLTSVAVVGTRGMGERLFWYPCPSRSGGRTRYELLTPDCEVVSLAPDRNGRWLSDTSALGGAVEQHLTSSIARRAAERAVLAAWPAAVIEPD